MAARKAAGRRQPRPKPRGTARTTAASEAAKMAKAPNVPAKLPAARADLGFGDLVPKRRTGADSRPRKTT